MFCCHCGKEVPENAKFCGSCGAQIPAPPVWEAAVPVEEAQAPVYEPAAEAVPASAPVAAPEAPAKKKKKPLVIALCIIIPVLILGGLGTWFGITMWNNQKTYEEAQALLEEGKYEEAVALLEEISDYKDAADIAEEWQGQLDAYAAAEELLVNGEYDAAEAAFRELEDFRDSDEFVQHIIPYEKAMYLYSCAANGDSSGLSLILEPGSAYSDDPYVIAQMLYNAAADIFASLGDYQDAADMQADCYCQIGLLLLEQELWAGVEGYLEQLDGNAYQTLWDAYMDCCADEDFLAALQEVLAERTAMAEDDSTTYWDLVEVEYTYLSDFYEMHFYDEELEALFQEYMDGVDQQYAALDQNGNVTNWVYWFAGGARRCDVIDTLILEHGFLENEQDLQNDYLGLGATYWACAAIEEVLGEQLLGVAPYWDEEAELYYLPFENTSGYGFTLILYLEFHSEGECVYMPETQTLEIPQDASGNIYLEFPADDVVWDSWYVFWDYYDIMLDGSLI